MLLSNKEPRPTFRLACDGESVLARLKWPCLTDPQEPHADLLSATRTLVQHSEVSVDLYHVKGHHASSNFGPLTCNATLNIEANQLAWTKLTLYTSSPVNFHIPWSQGVCYMGSHQMEKEFARTTQGHINGQLTKAYWEKCYNLLAGIWNWIDWESISRAMQELPTHHQHWVSKYVSVHFGTGKNMQRWPFRSSVQYPGCVPQLEDKVHTLTCLDTNMHDNGISHWSSWMTG